MFDLNQQGEHIKYKNGRLTILNNVHIIIKIKHIIILGNKRG